MKKKLLTAVLLITTYVAGYSQCPTADAGPGKSVCETTLQVAMDATVTSGANIAWTTSGSGSFSPDASTEDAFYHPSAADIAAGTVALSITASAAGCPDVTDQMTLEITKLPAVQAEDDKEVCDNFQFVSLHATGTNISGSGWTSNGAGEILSAESLNEAFYQVAPQDLVNGSVTFTISATSGNCPFVTDNLVVTFVETPTADAGPDQEVCRTVANVQLDGTIGGGAIGATWSTNGTGSFTPDATTLDAAYIPSVADKAAGSATLTLTSSGGCSVATNTMVITFVDEATADAGQDQIQCGKTASVLNGSVGGAATGGTWTSNGSGTFTPNVNTLKATYNPSTADVSAGSVILTLASTGGGCGTDTDQMTINYNIAPTANAGPDRTVCGNGTPVQLNGSVGGSATGCTWTTAGTGTFAPNATTLNATYTPSATDLSNGVVLLTLKANGGCTNVTDKMSIHFENVPTANAGPDQNICAANQISIDGSAGGETIVWTTSGSGSFTPNTTEEDVTYTASAADIAAGTVTLTLTATGVLCPTVSDAMVLTVTSVCISAVSYSNANEHLIKIYPNPATDDTQIELSSQLSLSEFTVYNILGEKVWTSSIENTTLKFDATILNKGVYYFAFTDKAGNKITKRFVKQ